MKRILISIIALVLFSAPVMAQMSVDDILKATPALPTVQQLLEYYSDDTDPESQGVDGTDVIADFLAAYNAAEAKIKAATSGANSGVIAGDIMGSMTSAGMSVRDAAAMGQSNPQALAQAAIAGRLGGMGLNMADLARMQNGGNMSEAEQNAMAERMMKAQTGMSMEDIQKMEKMSEAERAAYAQQRGLAVTPGQAAAIQGRGASQQQQAQMVMKYQELANQIFALQQEALAKKDAAKKAGLNLFNSKYAGQAKTIEEGIAQCIRDGANAELITNEADRVRSEAAAARMKVLRKQEHELYCNFYKEYLPIYRDAVISVMYLIKTKAIPLSNEREQLRQQLYSQTNSAEYAISIDRFVSAQAYSELSREIVDFQLETGNTYGF